MVFVLNRDGQPLMPTERYGKVRRMLKSGKATVVRRCPFTIKLLYETENKTQPVSLGIDAGSKVVGVSATTEQKVLYVSYKKLNPLEKRKTILTERSRRFLPMAEARGTSA